MTKMTKLCLFAVLLAVAIVSVHSAPAEALEEGLLPGDKEFEDLEMVQEEDRADRHRRVTCDLLSFGGKVGHSACAANCLSLGKAGGRCNDGVCQCRKTTFGDLWNKRFG